jgi:hypothetical protein
MFQSGLPLKTGTEEKEMNCKICDRRATKESYCDRHKRAYKSIIKKFDEWKQALEISWKGYLSKIIDNPLTGEWAKEVAEQLIESGEEKDVKQD